MLNLHIDLGDVTIKIYLGSVNGTSSELNICLL